LPAELQTVVAHELGHRRKQHVLLGTLLSIGGAIVATIVVWALLGTRAADPHRLPLLLLIALALSLAGLPAFTAISRRWERSADRYALELTNDPSAYQSAFRRLTAANLSDLDPPALVYLLLFTHPNGLQGRDCWTRIVGSVRPRVTGAVGLGLWPAFRGQVLF
jgi:STE24 endopeptidase